MQIPEGNEGAGPRGRRVDGSGASSEAQPWLKQSE